MLNNTVIYLSHVQLCDNHHHHFKAKTSFVYSYVFLTFVISLQNKSSIIGSYQFFESITWYVRDPRNGDPAWPTAQCAWLERWMVDDSSFEVKLERASLSIGKTALNLQHNYSLEVLAFSKKIIFLKISKSFFSKLQNERKK